MDFKPYQHQAEYLQSEAKYRLIQAANQSGSSTVMAYDASKFATDNPGSCVLLVSESIVCGRDTLQKRILEFCLPIKSTIMRSGIPNAIECFELENGSTIHIMSFGEPACKFQGINPDATYFDGGFYEHPDCSIPDLDILFRAMISGSSITLKVVPLGKYRKIFDMFNFLPGVEIFKFTTRLTPSDILALESVLQPGEFCQRVKAEWNTNNNWRVF